MAGETIAGRYRLLQPLGRGARSAVWLAHDDELERAVAVKTLAPSADRARFEREALAVARLSHPNICSLYDYGDAGGRPYMVLEYLPNGSLEERLRAGRALPDAETLRIATEIAAGLAHAHDRGLVHRDLKPSNVLFDSEWHAKIADFGIARISDAGALTEAGTVLGTASYISPEQASGLPAAPASDVYSFGVILFRMLTGSFPFVAANAMDLVRMHRDEAPRAVVDVRPDAPARLEGIVTAALAKDAADRPADGEALLRELAGSAKRGGSLRALYFGTYDRAHSRNVNAIAALRAVGVEIDERQVPVRRSGLLGALNVFAAELQLLAPRKRDFDIVIVGYPGHFDVPRARRVAGGRPLVFDAVLSLENELVNVRGRFRDRSAQANVLRAVDFRALRLPDLVVCGSDAEARYLSQLGAKQTASVFLGADETVFCETWSPAYPFTALQIADASAGVVRDAARQTETPVRVADAGEIADDDRPLALAHAGIVLGSFHQSRAIPAVVFEALATGAPVITADTDAARELLTDGDSAVLIPPESPAALAGAIERLAADEALRTLIAARGREIFHERASRQVLGERWRELLGQTLRE